MSRTQTSLSNQAQSYRLPDLDLPLHVAHPRRVRAAGVDRTNVAESRRPAILVIVLMSLLLLLAGVKLALGESATAWDAPELFESADESFAFEAAEQAFIVDQLETGDFKRCSTPPLTLADVRAFRNLTETLGPVREQWLEPINIPIVLHSIQSGKKGKLPKNQIKKQMLILNKAFAPAGIKFTLREVRNHNAPQYYTQCAVSLGIAAEMMQKLAVDPREAINVYVCKALPHALGFATMPRTYEDQADRRHGVVIEQTTLPNAKKTGYNEGDTLVHEIGHYLGLYHTFEFGCDENDHIDDTEPEAEAWFGCKIGKDTCPGGGPDPIHNFMNYSSDACLNEFSPGQAQFMHQAINAWRPALRTAPGA